MNRRDLDRLVDAQAALNATCEAEPPLYHVTYASRLPRITEDGLRPNASRSIGASAYDAHARDRVFLTEGDGVDFWHSRAEAFAEHASDNPLEGELVPVVLRVDPDCIDRANELVNDELGTRDASADAYFIQAPMEPIGSDCLEVFDGEDWVPLGTESLDLESAFDVQPNPDFGSDEYGEEPENLHYFKRRSPLKPELP
jgi:hypothetical protein